MEFFVYVFIFAFGASVGSFINVLTLRLGTGFGLGGSSFCFSCGKKLSVFELIPVVSFLLQKGRCRKCRAYISIQYPLVELISGVLFILIFLKIGSIFSPEILYYVVIFSILLAIAVYDFRHKIIPNQFVYPFIVLSLLSPFLFLDRGFLMHNLLAGPVLAFPFAFLWFISKGRWMGFGDAKLALGMGFLLGLSLGITALVISFWIGAIISLLLIGITHSIPLFCKGIHYTIKSEIPFGPFLVLGTFLVYFFDITFNDIQLLFRFFS